jgi:hypothetical protein
MKKILKSHYRNTGNSMWNLKSEQQETFRLMIRLSVWHKLLLTRDALPKLK